MVTDSSLTQALRDRIENLTKLDKGVMVFNSIHDYGRTVLSRLCGLSYEGNNENPD